MAKATPPSLLDLIPLLVDVVDQPTGRRDAGQERGEQRQQLSTRGDPGRVFRVVIAVEHEEKQVTRGRRYIPGSARPCPPPGRQAWPA